jgi:hypothetical protein
MEMTEQEFFETNKYIVLKNVLNEQACSILYGYCLSSATRTYFKKLYDKDVYDSDWDGSFNDEQAPNCYSRYGDPMFDTILNLIKSEVERITKLNLNSNYTYWRLYQKDNDLKRHIDRPSCEISATMCIGYNYENVDKTKYPNYNWAMSVSTKDRDDLPIDLYPGDMIIYKGCEVEHWREPLLGNNQAQAFFHYTNKDGEYGDIVSDGRPLYGIPKKFQRG